MVGSCLDSGCLLQKQLHSIRCRQLLAFHSCCIASCAHLELLQAVLIANPNSNIVTTTAIANYAHRSSCQDTPALRSVASREVLMSTSDGGAYFVDPNGCLHLKINDPGRTWIYDSL